jgi:hypothetical protein
MQIDFYTADDAAVAVGSTSQQAELDADRDPVVAANDNGLRWPVISFPEYWYASV